MKRLALLAGVALMASPAFALETPAPAKLDNRVCTLSYNASQVFSIEGKIGETLTVEFGPKETVEEVALSDASTNDIARSKVANVLWLKPRADMESQPISVRTVREDGSGRLYILQWQTVPDGSSAPCYLYRFTYPGDVAAARHAAWVRERRVREERAAEAALSHPETAVNNHYVAQGDASIAPSAPPGQNAVWDDGNSTFLRFPGNRRIPTIYVRNPDGKEAVAQYTVEQGGLVVLHQVARLITLRDGDAALCIWNQAYNATGSNPGTGTTTPDVVRAPASKGNGHV